MEVSTPLLVGKRDTRIGSIVPGRWALLQLRRELTRRFNDFFQVGRRSDGSGAGHDDAFGIGTCPGAHTRVIQVAGRPLGSSKLPFLASSLSCSQTAGHRYQLIN
jgi:hypothetical protein